MWVRAQWAEWGVLQRDVVLAAEYAGAVGGCGGAGGGSGGARRPRSGIGEFCEAEGVDAWFTAGGYLQVSTRRRTTESGTRRSPPAASSGAEDAVQPLSAAEVAERCASPAFRGGAFYPDAATVQPARLALGLRERLRAAGSRSTSARR